MNVTLPEDQQKWLEAEVAAGRFASVDEAVAAAVAGLMAGGDGHLTWAKSCVEEALEGIGRGGNVTLEDFCGEIEDMMAELAPPRSAPDAAR
jgi:antitoxin ParD1/3/4